MHAEILRYTPELARGWEFFIPAGQTEDFAYTVMARQNARTPADNQIVAGVHCRSESVAAWIQNALTRCDTWAQADREIFFRTEPYLHQLVDWHETRDLEAWGTLYEMGCGKSKTDVDTAAWQYERGKIDGLLIIAPKGCYQDWKDEHVPNHLPARIQRLHEEWNGAPGKAKQEALRQIFTAVPGRLNILSINVEALMSKTALQLAVYFLKHHKAMLLIDESTIIGNHKAARTKIILKELCPLAVSRRIMTGDGAPDSPLTLWSQGEALKKAALGYSTFQAFKTTFCHLTVGYGKKKNKAGQTVTYTFDQLDPEQGLNGYRQLEHLRECTAKITTIVKKADCLDLPLKIYPPPRTFDMGPKQAKAYRDMTELSVVTIEQVEAYKREHSQPQLERIADDLAGKLWQCQDCESPYVDLARCPFCDSPDRVIPEMAVNPASVSTASLALTLSLRQHQIACGFLVDDTGGEHGFDEPNPRLNMLLGDLEETSGKVLVWCCYRRNIFEIEAAAKVKFGEKRVLTYFGDTANEDRKIFKQRFQDRSDPFNLGIINIATGCRGLTLTAGNISLYYSDTYWREIRAQSEDRQHRIGQHFPVTYLDYVARGTVDETFLPIRLGKQKLSEAVTPSNWRRFLKGK